MSKSKLFQQTYIVLLVILLLTGCSGEPTKPVITSASAPLASTPTAVSPTTTSEKPRATAVVIDGKRDDWNNYSVLATDPAGDQPPGSPDLAEVRAFNNDRYFYLFIRLHQNGQMDSLNMQVDIDGGDFDYQLGVWPRENRAVSTALPIRNFNPLQGVTSAQDDVIEIKIPLSAFGNRPVQRFRVATNLNGPEGDRMENIQAKAVNETEPAAFVQVPTATSTLAVAKIPTASSTPAVAQVPTATSTPTATASNVRRPTGYLRDINLSLQIVHPVGIKIYNLRVNQKNDVFVTDYQGDTIYQLKENNLLVEYLKFPGKAIDYFNIAPDGTFWFVNNRDWGLYHVDKNNQPQRIASKMNRVFAFDSAGNLYAVDLPSDNVQKITPDGKVQIIATGFQSQRLTVAPDNSILIITYKGELARVEPNGSLKVIATGFQTEDQPAFAPDGTLYVFNWNGMKKIDLASGKVEQVDWANRYQQLGNFLTFDQRGIAYIYHPIQPLYRMNLETRTVEVVHSPYGNSWAMAVDPLTEKVYVAYGNRMPQGKTTLFRVRTDGTLEEIKSVPFGIEVAMTFGADGTGYLSVSDNATGSMIYVFKPQQGTLEEFQRPNCVAQGLAVEPGNSALWWTECNQLVSFNEKVGRRTIPYLGEVNHSTIAFGPDGTLYALIWLRASAPHLPMPHAIYRFENGVWNQLKDMTAKDPAITLATFAMCPDGYLYVATSIDGQDIGRTWTSMSSVLRLERDNSLTVLGIDLGDFDPLAIACAPSGTVYFTNAQGIYSISKVGSGK